MKTSDKILHKIKREGQITARQLADDLSITSMGARQHLQALEDDGLLNYSDIKVKVGRPARHWFLTQKGHNQFIDRHQDLSIDIIDAIDHAFGQSGINKIIAEREAKIFQRYQQRLSLCSSIEEKLHTLVLLREQEGYMAELEITEDGYLLTENHCPICHAAKQCPTLCQSEINIFQALLKEECQIVRQEHIIKGSHRCRYRITLTQ
ncbi:helix-turn-helix transcriptional regulator [Vibrio rumoiensis]|uniref:helix-turn-helix transcriptional regulator n=1 Tax=Vibrio rumoiensis TaxID=76258 RepID=UPI000B5C67A0|nr:metalloregulator ArsR/SmtB family transcription factor [Vibrio rumoiensis]